MKYFKDRLPIIQKKYSNAWVLVTVPDERKNRTLYKLTKLSDLSDKWYNVIKDFLEIRETGNKNIWSKGGYMASFYDNKSQEIYVKQTHVAPNKNTLTDFLSRLGEDTKEIEETPLKPETKKHFGDIVDCVKTFKEFIVESNQWKRISADKAVKLFPVFADIKRPGMKTLLFIEKPEDIESVENFTWWIDDHEECYGITINGVNVGFWWVDPVLKNMFIKENKKVILSALREEIARAEEDHIDGPRIDEIRQEIEHIKRLKPETKKHFGDILKEL